MNSYNVDYYENGKELGISGYSDYKWLPDLTLPMCESIIKNLSINLEDRVLDYGCAKGYLVKAFHILGVKNTFGIDISEYAISKCDPEVSSYLKCLNLEQSLSSQFEQEQKFDWIVCKDVLEHLQKDDLTIVLSEFKKISDNVFIAVPLGSNGKYFIEEYENDVTHIIREDMEWWTSQIKKAGYEVTCSYSFPGVKENWSQYMKGNAFIVAKSNT